MKPTFFPSAAEFRNWLERHHADERELPVRYYTTGSGRQA
jgi:hypothetical protein